ncbi:MAG TPA: ATP-binding protein [Acidimicrobiales bacterium]
MRLPPHEATTAQLGAIYPGMLAPSPPLDQVFIGRELSGELFCHDPFELYRLGALTNPNMIVLGQIGRGKSALVKTFLYRQAAFGRRVIVIDPKGEYAPLASALGCQSLKLAPGGALRLNPLAFDEAAKNREERRRVSLSAATAIVEAVVDRVLAPGETLAIELAWDQVAEGGTPSLPALARALLDPERAAALRLGSSPAELRAEGRLVAFELRRFMTGELAGIFDGLGSNGLVLDVPALVLDFSAIYRSPALGPAVACLQMALEAKLRAGTGAQTIFVVDEAWAVLVNPGTARFLQASFKLARTYGVANLVVAHRVSDLSSLGATGSVVANLAGGLLADCETVVCYAQGEAEIAECTSALGLSAAEASFVRSLRRGAALWHVGSSRHVVDHRLSPFEHTFVDTDQAMRTVT